MRSRKKPLSSLTELESDAVRLARALWDYQELRMGKRLYLAPSFESGDREWISFAQLLTTDFTLTNDPQGEFQRAKQLLLAARTAYLTGSREAFRQQSAELQRVLCGIGVRGGYYPAAWSLQLEMIYGRWRPFHLAWLLILVCLTCLVVAAITGRNSWRQGAYGSYALAATLLIVGFAMRMAISGRPPVTNLYESVLFLALGILVLGAIFNRFYQERLALIGAAVVAALALSAAHALPAMFDAGIRPLEPVLRSNYWLAAHAVTIGYSLAAFAMSLALANARLVYVAVGYEDEARFERLAALNYRAVQVGVLLLALGIATGAAWADHAWGRFWGWDPKEAWALLTLLAYMSVLHALNCALGGKLRSGRSFDGLFLIRSYDLVRSEFRTRQRTSSLRFWSRRRGRCLWRRGTPDTVGHSRLCAASDFHARSVGDVRVARVCR